MCHSISILVTTGRCDILHNMQHRTCCRNVAERVVRRHWQVNYKNSSIVLQGRRACCVDSRVVARKRWLRCNELQSVQGHITHAAVTHRVVSHDAEHIW